MENKIDLSDVDEILKEYYDLRDSGFVFEYANIKPEDIEKAMKKSNGGILSGNHLKYKDAIKLPKGGAVKMDKDNFTALASEMISSKQGTRPEAIYNWANKHGVDLSKYGYILADIKSNDELLEDVLNDKFDAVKMLIEKKENERFVKQKEGTKVIVKSINDKGEPKYKKGDSVGYKSDSDFTKSNKDRPVMTVVSSKWNDKNKNWEYILKGTVGAEAEYGLESRENVSLTEKKSDLDVSKKLTRKQRRAEIAKDYDLTEEEVNEFMRISSVIKSFNKPTKVHFGNTMANKIAETGLLKKENDEYDLTESGRLISDEFFNINDSEIKDNSDLEKAKEEYPIVLEWGEGLEEKNIGIDYLWGLERALKASGLSKTPNDTVIKNKVWFKKYPHFVYIENGTDEKDGNYNPQKDYLIDWLKKYDNKFDWTIYESGENYGFDVKKYTPKSEFKAGDLVSFSIYDLDAFLKEENKSDYIIEHHYGYVVSPTKYVKDSDKWKPHWTYEIKDFYNEDIIYNDIMEGRISSTTQDKINKEVTEAKIEEGTAELLTKEEAEKLSKKFIELLSGDYNQKNETLHNWFGEVISRYPKMLVEWQNAQLDYLPKKEQELLEYLYNEDLPNLKQFFNSLMRYNVGKKELIGLYELISERLVNDKLPKKVDFKLDPNDKGLSDIFKKIVSDDDLRPKLTGIYFDDNGVVGTDAQKMLFIAGKSSKKGIFGIGKKLGQVIDDKYAVYQNVIPKQATDIISIDRNKVENIVTSLKTIKNAKYSYIDIVTLSLYKGEGTYFDINLLIELLESWLKIGFSKLEFSYRNTDKANKTILIIAPSIKEFIKLKGSGSIIMARMKNQEGDAQFIINQTEMYIDVSTGKAETAGITDDLYSELNLALWTTGAIEEKEQIEELEALIELLKEVVAENPKDLDSSDALELYEETLAELKSSNTDKFAHGGEVGCGCNHDSFAEGGEIKSKKVIRRNLPINKEYKLVDSFYTGGIMDNPMSCENCGRIIANVAVIQDEDGKKYDVGMDCAETLSQIKNSLEFNVAQNDFAEANAIRTKIKNAFKKYPDARLIINNTVNGEVYVGVEGGRNSSLVRQWISKDLFNKYLPDFKNKISNPEKNGFIPKYVEDRDKNKLNIDTQRYKTQSLMDAEDYLFDDYKAVISRESVPNYNDETGEIRNYNNTIIIKVYKGNKLIGDKKTYMAQDIPRSIFYAINEYDFSNFNEKFENGGYITTLPYSEILKRLKDEFGIDESDGKSIHGSDLMRIIQVDKNLDPNSGMNLSKVLTDNGWTIIKDNYKNGGKLKVGKSYHVNSLKELLELSKEDAIKIIAQVLSDDDYYSNKRGGYDEIAKPTYLFCKDLMKFNHNSPMRTIFGDLICFEPDDRLIKRDGYFVAQIKYASHQVTQTDTFNGVKIRVLDGSKIENFANLALGILFPDERAVDSKDENKIYYYKKISTKKNGILVFRTVFGKDGHIQYITIMPDKSNSYWENYKTGKNEKGEVRYSLASPFYLLPSSTSKDEINTEETPSLTTDSVNVNVGSTNVQIKNENMQEKSEKDEKFSQGGEIEGVIFLVEPYFSDEKSLKNSGEVGEKKLYYATYDDNNIGILLLDEDGNKKFEILHASVLRGSNYSSLSNRIDISNYNYGKIKKASKKDFDIYRVSLPPDFNELNSPTNLKDMIKKGDVVLFKCGDNDTGCRGEVLDVISKDEFLISKGIKSMMISKDEIVGIAPSKINTIFERDFSIYDERVLGINSTEFYLTYAIGNNPFEVSYNESNEYGYGIYAYDSKDSNANHFIGDTRTIKLVPSVKKPLIFLNDDGSSFNTQYKEAYDNAVKYDGVKSKDEFTKKMIEQGYDSMLVSDIHGLHLVLFYNDPELYKIKSDLAN